MPRQHAPIHLDLDARTYARGLSCVHCGLCLPACPTYLETQHEADSPRGRIQLMLGLADGVIQPTASVRKHLDLCLDCRGCETACPSGVVYHELIEETRARLAATQKQSVQDRLLRWIFFHIFTRPQRLKLALLPARLMQKIGLWALLEKAGIFNVLPPRFRKMIQMLPSSGSVWPRSLPAHRSAARTVDGKADAPPKTVAFFGGCVGSVMFDRVNRQAAELLASCGVNVDAPRAQVCCGAIHQHNGDEKSAADLARRNIDIFLPESGPRADYIVTTIAGCGAMLREYDFLLRDDPNYAERAREFVSRVRDISEALVLLGPPPAAHAVHLTATYHDACHLAHAQQVTAEPRQLLASIPGLKLLPLPESEICCGAAGTYNLTQPIMSGRLAERKLKNIAASGASICVTGNVGCAMQIQSEAAASGIKLRVMHPVELLHEAAFGAVAAIKK